MLLVFGNLGFCVAGFSGVTLLTGVFYWCLLYVDCFWFVWFGFSRVWFVVIFCFAWFLDLVNLVWLVCGLLYSRD